MDNPEIINIIQQFFISARAERKDVLKNNVTVVVNDFVSRNMLHSSVAIKKLSEIYAEEVKLRFAVAWESIKGIFEKRNVLFSKDDVQEIEESLKRHVNNEIDYLSRTIDSRFKEKIGPLNSHNSILMAIASARNTVFPKISAELNFFITSGSPTTNDTAKDSPRGSYVDNQRIDELKAIKNPDYDLKRLIQLCKEINIANQNDCHMTIAIVLRAIIDHVPPIFGFDTFSNLANNYRGSRSFKESMQHLENSSRKIADLYLHGKIRKIETLPTFTQVNFMADLDLLLSEIIINIKEKGLHGV